MIRGLGIAFCLYWTTSFVTVTAESEIMALSLHELMQVSVNKKNTSKLYFSKSNPPTEKSLNIALIVPLSEEREQSVEVIAAARIAAKEINESGGINGKKLVVIVADDNFDLSHLSKLVNELKSKYQIQAIIGPITSKQSHDLFNSTPKSERLPMLLPAANADVLSDLDDDDLVFRLSVTNSQLAETIDQFLIQKEVKKLAIFYQRDVFGTEIAENVTTKFEKHDGEVVFRYPMSGLVDYEKINLSNELKTLQALKVDALFMPILYNELKVVLKQLTEIWQGTLPIIVLPEHASRTPIEKERINNRSVCVYSAVPYLSNKWPEILTGVEEILETRVATYTAAYVYDITYLVAGAFLYQNESQRNFSQALRHITAARGPIITPKTLQKIDPLQQSHYQFIGQSGAVVFDQNGDNDIVSSTMESFHQYYAGDKKNVNCSILTQKADS
jgi:ABC-type branched-subunit amino acid transport system substrate-binding protein